MRTAGFILLALALLFVANDTTQAITEVVSYQGRLLDSGGNPVSNGSHVVLFEMFASAVPGGTPLWSSGNRTIVTADGFFNYPLGDSTAFPAGMFAQNDQIWLEITVVGDPPLSPRTRVAASGYAFHALSADITAGVTQIFDAGDVVITGFLNPETQDSINCPTDGYVMVNSTLAMNCNHTSGDDDVLFVLITDSTASVSLDQDGHAWSLPPGAATGFYGTVIHTHRVFTVSAGWNEFYTLSFQNAGGGTDNFASADVVTTLLFIPQSYGTVKDKSAGSSSGKFNGAPMKQD